MAPLICTTNTLGHIDYGIPIVANKSSDYRTCTGSYHRFVPELPQNYDCRFKANIKPVLLESDVTTRDEVFQSSYRKNYELKLSQATPSEKCFRAPRAVNTNYIRNVQEKMFQEPPTSLASKISEMKNSYQMHYHTVGPRQVHPPAVTAKCEIIGLGRDEQPAVRPEEKGYWKHLDMYMTTNRELYIPYTDNQLKESRNDITTFYNVYGVYKDLKVNLPRPDGNKAIFDKLLIKYENLPKRLSTAPNRCPNFGMQSENQAQYKHQSYSDLYPYLAVNGVKFDDSLCGAGPWQNICPPGMYCTEYCHVGTGWPVRAVIEASLQQEYMRVHDLHNKT